MDSVGGVFQGSHSKLVRQRKSLQRAKAAAEPELSAHSQAAQDQLMYILCNGSGAAKLPDNSSLSSSSNQIVFSHNWRTLTITTIRYNPITGHSLPQHSMACVCVHASVCMCVRLNALIHTRTVFSIKQRRK